MARYTLGLDLGSNSVGWALVAQDGTRFDNGTPILAGVRVFPEGVADLDQKKERPRGQERREKRSQRRVHYRRRQRRALLRRALAGAGLFPAAKADFLACLALEPYTLRARGLDERLEPHEFGRALYHLCERRGFKTNRKSQSKEDNKITKDASALQQEIESAGCRTLGEYRAKRLAKLDHGQRIRGRYTLRAMYEHEFNMLWESQRRFHADTLSDDLKTTSHDAIFYQRPLRFDPEVIGDCELEPGEKRCPLAHWLAQRFRMLQEINHLRVTDAAGDRPLSRQERAMLAAALGTKREMDFDAIRKCLGFLATQTFSLETEGKRKKLKGNVVEAALQNKVLRKWYKELSNEQRQTVNDALAEIQDPQELRRIAAEQWLCNAEQVEQLLKFTPPDGYLRLSAKAIRKILPYLEPDHVCDQRCREMFPGKDSESGHVFSEAKALAGYPPEPPIPTFEFVPPIPRRNDKKSWEAAHPTLRHMGTALTNPLVRRALTETRKVVNAIVREFGKPEEIIIELAREMKHTKEQRQEIHWDNVHRNEKNEEIKKRLQEEFHIPSPSRDDIIKYRLWQECSECVYTGKPIPKNKLFTPEIQVEHIYPLDRSLDDSYLNKTLCYGHETNTLKGNRTPYEAFADTPHFDAILKRAERLPWKKRRRFTVREVAFDEFASRQLNDTRFASRFAARYLRTLGVPVRPVKGQTTSKLAHYWGLYGVLGTDYSKDRDDHRYHAIDAIVVALTSRSHLQRLSTILGRSARRTPLDPPWDGFWDHVRDAVASINVSYRPARKLAGGLHNETALGPTPKSDTYTYRVPLERLTPAMVADIRDPAIQRIVRKRLNERGLEETGSAPLGKVLTEPPLTMPSGVPIKRVRIQTVEKTAIPIRKVNGRPVKFVLPGGNHHIEIYRKPDGSWTGRCVSRFDACKRLRKGLPVVDREGEEGWTFLMSLCINDMVQLTYPDTGEVKLCRVQWISDGPDIMFRLHSAARIDDKETGVRVKSWGKMQSLGAQKVTVTPLGRIQSSHD